MLDRLREDEWRAHDSVLHDFPDAEAATEEERVAASRFVRKNDFT